MIGSNADSKQVIVILIIMVIASCNTSKQLFIPEIYTDLERLNIHTVREFENRKKAKNITPGHLITLDTGIYPNENGYRLETPQIFTRPDTKHFKLETDYYYTAADSSVKVILYEWADPTSLPHKASDKHADKSQKLRRYQLKFDQLKTSVEKWLGEPVEENIQQGKVPIEKTFRDDVKWSGTNGMYAYLFMFGNDKSGYRKIRLAIYRD